MTAEQWRLARDLFDRLRDLEPEERRRTLDRRCADDPTLRRRVESLLLHHDRGAEFLETPVLDALLPGGGRQIGPYRLLRLLGSGGTGRVFLGEPQAGGPPVALKLIPAVLLTPELERRLERERRALEALDHPGIARLLDAGRTEDGVPYLVTEYVEGQSITEHCDTRRSSIDERLQLFLALCEAVATAHDAGVLHRDIKPANILVTASGEPKLLDFDVAKLLAPDDDRTTTSEVRALTPNYASPEHLAGDRLTRASDVYSLGVLLYDLLCGRRPFERDRSLSPHELAETMARRRPEPPSSWMDPARHTTTSSDAAALRRATLGTLRAKLEGDLDTIVLRALSYDPRRRQQSVRELSAELNRHLNGLPQRSAPRLLTRAFARRRSHRTAPVIAALGVVVGSALATFSWLGWREARLELARSAEERTAGEELTRLLADTLELADPDSRLGDSLTARDILDRGLDRSAQLEAQPLVRASLERTIGSLYSRLGLYAEAQDTLESALGRQQQLLEPSDPELVKTLGVLSDVLRLRGRFAEAEDRARQVLAARARDDASEGRIASDRTRLALVLTRRGEFEEAERLARLALETHRRTEGPDHLRVAEDLDCLASLYHDRGDYEAAEEHAREALRIYYDRLGHGNTTVARLEANLAYALVQQGRYEDAKPLLDEAQSLFESLLGPEHPDVAQSQLLLGDLLYYQADYPRADALYERALAALEHAFGGDHPAVAAALNNQANLLYRIGELGRAEELHERALRIRRRALGPDHPEVGQSLNNLAGIRQARSDFAGAESLYRAALEIFRRSLGAERWAVGDAMANLAWVLRSQGKTEESEDSYRQAIEILRTALGEEHPRVAHATSGLAWLLQELGQVGEAESLHLQALTMRREHLGERHEAVAESLTLLADLYCSSGRPEAMALAEEARSILALPDDHWRVAMADSVYGCALAGTGRIEEARQLLEDSRRRLVEAMGPRFLPSREAAARLEALPERLAEAR